ncbi:MAG: tRNA pseudouridine synthase A, partial [Phycisphaerales bacterium]|nr:tRNA pseudouridine synthase A [Phycisphaerales bacterium]
MVRYRLTIAYDGTDFCGWQKQEPPDPDALVEPGGERPRLILRTVQHVVEQAVREIVREPVLLQGASRADAGVHVLGQVACFTCSGDGDPDARHGGWPLDRGTERLRKALNGRLPDDVLVTLVEPVALEFDPIADCVSKGYSYTIHDAIERCLWDRRYVQQIWQPLDHEAMHDAARVLVGEHDFASFAAAGHGRQTTVRTIHACDVSRPEPNRVRLDVSGNGFLYNMVRIIAG